MIKSRPLIIATSVMMIAMPHVFGQSSLTLVGSVPGFSVPLGFAPAPNYSAVRGAGTITCTNRRKRCPKIEAR